MAIGDTLGNLFGNSPLKAMRKHMVSVNKGVELLPSFFIALCDRDIDTATKIQSQISDYEHEADDLKAKIRMSLPKSVFLPVDRSDLLLMLQTQDKIANQAKDLSGIALGREMRIPEDLTDDIHQYVLLNIKAVERACKAINQLGDLLEAGFRGRELKIVDDIIEEIDDYEHKSDSAQRALRHKLFAIEKDFNPVDVMFMYRTIEALGDLSDRAQSVGARLQILTAR